MSKDKVSKEHTVTVSGLKAANYMIENGSEMIGIENIPDSLPEIRLIFRSENTHNLYNQAITGELPELTFSELDRIYSMLTLLICAKIADLKEEVGL